MIFEFSFCSVPVLNLPSVLYRYSPSAQYGTNLLVSTGLFKTGNFIKWLQQLLDDNGSGCIVAPLSCLSHALCLRSVCPQLDDCPSVIHNNHPFSFHSIWQVRLQPALLLAVSLIVYLHFLAARQVFYVPQYVHIFLLVFSGRGLNNSSRVVSRVVQPHTLILHTLK